MLFDQPFTHKAVGTNDVTSPQGAELHPTAKEIFTNLSHGLPATSTTFLPTLNLVTRRQVLQGAPTGIDTCIVVWSAGITGRIKLNVLSHYN